MVPPPGPVAAPTSKDFFTGKGAAISKVVNGDANPGYFYASATINPTPTFPVTMLSAADQAGLPAGITHAHRSNNLAAGLLIIGYNFRANDGTASRPPGNNSRSGLPLLHPDPFTRNNWGGLICCSASPTTPTFLSPEYPSPRLPNCNKRPDQLLFHRHTQLAMQPDEHRDRHGEQTAKPKQHRE